MRAFVEGVGLCGPGLNGWAASRPMLAGVERYAPAPVVVPPSPLLPANERRRMVQTVKLALAVGAEAFADGLHDPAGAATVFTSSGGDGETIHDILSVLASPNPEVSPTRFHNSVHNAPAGYWSIATRCREPSSSLCGHDASFAAGLIEAAAQASVDDRVVALIAYDLPYPEPLHSTRPIAAVFGMALVLSPCPSKASLARLDIELGGDGGRATAMADAALEKLRQGAPAARSLPLLAGLARNAVETVILDYVSGCQLAVSIAPSAPAAASARDAQSLAASR